MSNDFDVPADPSGVHPQSGVQPVGVAPLKRRGRPPGLKNKPKKNLPGPKDPAEVERKGKRPACEGKPREYDDEHREVVWGVEPSCHQFKRKGIAVLWDPKHKGGQVLLMPVTDDDGVIRWRYRFIPNVPRPFSYEMIPLEPGESVSLGEKLVELGTAIINGTTKWFGGQGGADQTTIDYIKERKDDLLGQKIRKEGIF